MNINQIGSIPDLDNESVASVLRQAQSPSEEGRSAFDQFLKAAIDVINETSARLHTADIAQVDFATGKTNDVLDVVFAQNRASSALSFTVQVGNRIIEAYREIMRMQV